MKLKNLSIPLLLAAGITSGCYPPPPSTVCQALTPSTVATGAHPQSIALDSAGQHAYVSNYGANTISQYKVDNCGGLVPMTTPTVATGTHPGVIAIVGSTAKFAYV